ncbi:MAG TPA: LPS export ABC transporter periplasmic protein LptC [Candidatus Eremiobacteraceae bacterium]|nr:LPS export ABC transporter periplasmic protein LptC [Candidatus Eremiobacteraceae bacterium]
MKHAALLAGLTLLCTGCGKSAAPVSSPSIVPLPTATPTTSYIIRATAVRGRPVMISNIVNGKPEYQLRASSVVYATSLQRGTFKDNTLLVYKGRQVRLTVTAPTAMVDEANHNVVLTQGVVARTPAGDSLRADSMTYNAVTELLTGDGHVVVQDAQGNKLTGNHAIADLDLQQIRLLGDITAKGAPPR